jgi:hypothetical protein
VAKRATKKTATGAKRKAGAKKSASRAKPKAGGKRAAATSKGRAQAKPGVKAKTGVVYSDLLHETLARRLGRI